MGTHTDNPMIFKKTVLWVLFCFFLAIPVKAMAYETAWFPAPRVYLTQLAYESYSHGNYNAIDISPDGNVFAPFTGIVKQTDPNWGFVLLQSTDKVYYADGSLDYMTVGFMHDSDISNITVGQTIVQGQDFYQAGGQGKRNGENFYRPDAYGAHVDITVHKGKKDWVNPYGNGDYFAFNAFVVNTAKTTIQYPGQCASGNVVNNGAPTSYAGLWRTSVYNPNKYEPEGTVDHVVSQEIVQVINIKGWAFDRDNLNEALSIEVYIGGEAGSADAEKHTIASNQLREDILKYYPGVGSYHGFQTNIATAKTGSQTVFVYALNANNVNERKLLSANVVTIKGSLLNYSPGKTVPEGIYNIVSAVDQNYEITVDNNSNDNSRNLHIWRQNNDNNYSKWKLIYVGDGYYKIKNIGSSKCFDVSGGTGSLSANVMQYEDHGGDNQLWRIFFVNDEYVLQPKCAPGACLDLDQNKAQDNQNVSISNEHLNTNQRWLFVPTDTLPIGTVDHIVSEQKAQTINLKGWAYDRADLDESLNILVYVGGEAGDPEAEKHIIKANLLREDILAQNPGVGDHHGFQADVVTTKTGTQPIYVYAANAGKENARKLLGSSTVAIKEGKVYTITYYLDGGENPAENPVEYSENTIITINDPSKEHYTFVGWYLSEDGDDKFDGNQIYAEDLNLYARWEKTEYEITFFVNHEIDPETEQEGWIRKIAYGDLFGELPVPEWTGYVFTGWFTEETSGTQITAESVYTEGTSFYAHWEQNLVHITFDGNRVFTEALDDYARDILPGQVYGALPEISTLGYDFLGWFTDPVDGSEVTAEAAVSITSDHTLYAHWTAKEFTLSFDANMEGVENPESRKVRYKDALGELPVCSSDDYDFIGWFDAADGTKKFTSTSVYNEVNDLTLFAKWEKKETPHKHTYESAVTKDPSCTEAGVRTCTCAECGDVYTEEIPATGHTAADEKTGIKDATCTEDGYTGDVVCKNCGAVMEKGQRIAATGHKHITTLNAKEASCTEDGYTGDIYCLDCEALITEGSVIKAAGHQWVAGDIMKEVTCTEAGEQEYTCSVCGETKKEELPCNGHLGPVVIRLVKGATCTQDGYTGVTLCTKCSEVIKEGEKIPATGHQHTVLLNDKEATCAQEGYTGDTYCADCEELVKEGSVIPKTEHIHTEIRDAKEATCAQEGYTGDTYCADCGELITSGTAVPVKEHTWNQGAVTKAATATEAGVKTYTCTVCGETKEEAIPATGETKPVTPDKPVDPVQPPASEKDLYGNTLVSEQQIENAVLAMPDDNDPAISTFSLLQARAKKVTKNSITIAWKRVPKAASYTVYGNKCGKGNRYQKLATVTGGQYVHKNLKKGTYYKFLIVANGGGKAQAVSKTIHAATAGGKVGNNKSVKITSKKKLTLKKGKTSKITAKAVAKSGKLKVKKHRKLAFETSNPKVATVNKSGKIKAVGKGSCTIYVYAQDGIFAKVTVKVK